MATWYYAKGNQQFGPVELEQLQVMARQGQVGPADLVWTEGMAQWLPAETALPGFAASAGAVPAGMGQPVGTYPTAGMYPPAGGGGGGGAGGVELGYFNPVANPVRYGGFWIRFWAAFVDGILLMIAQWVVALFTAIVLSIPWGYLVFGDERAEQGTWAQSVSLLLSLLSYVAGWLYEAYMTSKYGATLGKMACGLRVERLGGGQISFGRATGRHFAKLLSLLTLLVGYIMAAFTQRKQALHDIICDTVVLKR